MRSIAAAASECRAVGRCGGGSLELGTNSFVTTWSVVVVVVAVVYGGHCVHVPAVSRSVCCFLAAAASSDFHGCTQTGSISPVGNATGCLPCLTLGHSKHLVPDRVKSSFVIFDLRAL